MEQVFSVLPVLPDDQQAYAAYHKAESEKRLVAQNRINALAKKEKEAKEREAKEKAAKPPRRPLRRKSADEAEASTNQEDSTARSGGGSGDDANLPCTPERILEIKTLLLEIYTEYCPEKINSVDYLLHKYASREEEFLQFVRRKYNIVDPEQEKKLLDNDKPVLEEPPMEPERAAEPSEEGSAVETNTVECSVERGQRSPAGGRDYSSSSGGGRDRTMDTSSPHKVAV